MTFFHICYQFTVTADYKALLLCTKKKTGEEVKLGGQGKGVEACTLSKIWYASNSCYNQIFKQMLTYGFTKLM